MKEPNQIAARNSRGRLSSVASGVLFALFAFAFVAGAHLAVRELSRSAMQARFLNTRLVFMLGLSVLWGVASVQCEQTLGDGPAQPKLKSIAFEAGSAYEVRYAGGDEPGPVLFRFHRSGKFDLMDARGVFLMDGAQWKRERSDFKVVTASNLNWQAEGSYVEDGIQGTVRRAGLDRKFIGHRVDYNSYEFPLQEGEVIVLLRMKWYHDWPLSTGKKLPDVSVRQDDSSEAFSVYGFEFEVLAPSELKGMLVTAHHDGDFVSGPAAAIAVPGKTYLWRTRRTNIGGREFGICSVVLHWMKDTDDLTPDPRYRPGLGLLKTLGPATKSGRTGTEPDGPANGSPPIPPETNRRAK